MALGYCTLLLLMVSEIMDLPLRYPMLHRGSRSVITDHITPKLSDSERQYVTHTTTSV